MEKKIYIKRQGNRNTKNQNTDFNKTIGLIIREIFQNERLEEKGYIPINFSNETFKKESKFSFIPSNGSELCSSEIEHKSFSSKLKLLPEYEKLILSNLLFGKFQSYTLCGAMGSGKSSTSSYVLNFAEKCFDKNELLIIRLNFNEGFLSKNKETVLFEFQKRLFNTLRCTIEDIFFEEGAFEHFLSFISLKENRENFSDFLDFLDLTFTDEWAKKSIEEKLSRLFIYIKNYYSELPQHDENKFNHQVQLLLRILDYVHINVLKKKGNIILFFDNIDWFRASIQYDILDLIVRMVEGTKLRSLINMRRSTFRRFTSRSAFVFGILHHYGPDPIRVIQSRINQWLSDWKNNKHITELNPIYQSALKNRLLQLKKELEEGQKNSFGTMLSYLGGKSIRLSLELATRLVVNNIIPFNQASDNKNSLARTLLVGTNIDNSLSSEDPYLINIFEEIHKGLPSLLSLRILHLVKYFEKDEARKRTGYIFSLLERIGKWNKPTFVRTLNQLLNIQRPLLWLEGASNYDNFEHMNKDNDVLHLTEIGEGYLNGLSINLRYIQESLLSLRWDSNAVPHQISNNFFERMKAVRMCLKLLVDKDYQELNLFRKWHDHHDEGMDLEVCLIMSRVVYNVAKSFIAISKSIYKKEGYFNYDEFENWRSFAIGISNQDPDNEKLDSLQDEFNFMGRVG